ncbi:MAG: hypothetical protein ACYTEQ_16910, partial [Planctomycetota bacterium]
MSYVVPRYRDLDGYPLDYKTTNENFQEFVHEIEGNLGEHNWDEGAITARGDMDPGAVVDVVNAKIEVDPFDGTPPVDGDPVLKLGDASHADAAGNIFIIGTGQEWVAIDDMSTSIPTKDAILWICGSLQQVHFGWGSNTISDEIGGIQYAIRLDGVVLSDSIVGGADRSNDPTGPAMHHSSS